MDMFEELIESAKSFANDEFVTKLQDEANKVKENITTLSNDTNRYKSELEKAIEKRDKIKGTVKSLLGVDDVSEESLTTAINTLKNGDTKQLQELLETTKSSYEEKLTAYEQRVKDKELELGILESGALDGVTSKAAKKLIIDELRNGATVKDGSLVYVDENGSIIYTDDGKPLSVTDKVQALYNDDDYKAFFPTKRGGGKQEADSGKVYGHKDISKLSRKEKAKLMSELSPQEYQKLVLQSLKKGK